MFPLKSKRLGHFTVFNEYYYIYNPAYQSILIFLSRFRTLPQT